MGRKRQVIEVIRVAPTPNAADIIEAACRLVDVSDVGHAIDALRRAIRPKELVPWDRKRHWREPARKRMMPIDGKRRGKRHVLRS